MYAEIVQNFLGEVTAILGMIGIVASIVYTVGSMIKARLKKEA